MAHSSHLHGYSQARDVARRVSLCRAARRQASPIDRSATDVNTPTHGVYRQGVTMGKRIAGRDEPRRRQAGTRAERSSRGKRRAPRRAVARHRWLTIPTFLAVTALAVGPAASSWVADVGYPAPASNGSLPTLPVPTDQPLAEPSFPASNENPYLSFATFNIAKPANTAVPKWNKRRLALGRTINESKADVVGIQEANNQTVLGEGGKRMRTWQDIQALARPGGFVGINVEQDTCGGACVHSAHLLYKSATVEQVDLPGNLPSGGQGELRDIAAGLHYAKHREFSWAYLRGKNGTGTFLAISVHLNNERNSTGKADRAKVGAAMTGWAEALNKKSGMEGVPLVLMGDFNSYPRREPKGMPYQLKKQGWHDSYDVASEEYKFFDSAYTTSYTKGNRSGWPKRPIKSGNPVRIDYIMYRGAGLRADLYAVDLWLKPDGTFDNNYRASDHMMVQAFIYFDGAKAATK